MVAPKVVTAKPPASALVECPKAYPRSRMKTTRDAFDRADHNERALAICAAQIDTIREWAETIDVEEMPR